MSTNHYLVYPEQVDVECHCCGHVKQEQKKLHLGKSSYGWVYSLRVYPEMGLRHFYEMEEYVTKVCGEGGWIEDEYGTVLEHQVEWFYIVKRRSSKDNLRRQIDLTEGFTNRRYSSIQHYLDENNAVEGPNNLLRHRIDGSFCIGHGEGTWDYFASDFS